jgi:hypothetical protein
VTKQAGCVIQVAGDPTVDWLLVAPEEQASGLQVTYIWAQRTSASAYAQPGGSALLTALLKTVCSSETSGGLSAMVSGITLTPELLRDPQATEVTRTFTLWQPYPRRTGEVQGVWRMHTFLGQQPASDATPSGVDDECREAPGCLVIEDADLGFRGQREAWPAFLQNPTQDRPSQVIAKMASPIATGSLWETLAQEYAAVVTAYFTIGDFRRDDARVGEALSWEQISSEVVQAVKEHKEISRIARVVVSLGASGAVLIERNGASFLVFDPACQEGDWERERPGNTLGLGTCIIASLTAQYARKPEAPDWLRGVKRGLEAGRELYERGFVFDDEKPGGDLRFPINEVATALHADADDGIFECVEIPPEEQWTILASAFREGYRSVAEQIVVEGPSQACRGVPVERMGSWASIDRTEIESMRSVRNIIREYVTRSRRARPLSIAVFGPPGAGKSFAIKQMAREWTLGGSRMAVLEYNLSQFANTDELAVAFQRLRDCAVNGGLPLVFWDEFDAPLAGRELGWLPQFLAPMQDGGFLDGGMFRPIGPAIFVFAGGTHPTMTSFKERAAHRAEVKATDFLSRLRGFVDILGPNPLDDGDKAFVLRRAFLLRALLEQRAPQILSRGRASTDPGVLRAFLDVAEYVHGARSMESIIDMSALSGKLRYERSALPAQHQLGLHVDAEEFLALVKQTPAL